MGGQRSDRHRALGMGTVRLARLGNGLLGFQFLERQLQLSELLRRPAELHAPKPGDLDAQRLDEKIAADELGADKGELRLQRGDPLIPIGCGDAFVRHGKSISERLCNGRRNAVRRVPGQPASEGVQLRSGRRQSMPSSSIESCAGVRLTVPAPVIGHTNRPRSMRFENRHNP